ncbi:tail fiber assembly protein [Pseudomonas donghuensis]|nr:tail fiber assembly protein [Pseudomonas donghuensis]
MEEAIEDEAAALNAWKKYRVALSRVPDLPGYPVVIDWSATPA